MPVNRSRKRVAPAVHQWIITLAFLCGAAGVAKTADRLYVTSSECAARDLKLVTLIERHGEARDVASNRLAEAAFTMLRARKACDDGRYAEALAIYDSVLLAPGFAQATR